MAPHSSTLAYPSPSWGSSDPQSMWDWELWVPTGIGLETQLCPYRQEQLSLTLSVDSAGQILNTNSAPLPLLPL